MAGETESVVVKKKEMDIRRDLELLEKIQDKEERIRNLLSPAEAYILWFQKILVWEHPYLSVTLYLVVNILFWLATTWRIYCLIGITGMIIVSVEMWISYIWAETFGNNSSDATDSESWTEVCPHLLSVPEISNYLARGWVHGLHWLDEAISFRNENRPKFFVYSIFFLTLLAIIGVYIPGIYFSYFTVMGLLLWPAISYNNILSRIQSYVNPAIERIEQGLHIKRKRTKKNGKRRKGKRRFEAGNEDSDSDRDLDEFIPPADSLILTTLTTAVVGPMAGDEDSTSYSPSEFTPRQPSQAESREHSDDEDLLILTRDIKEMPSIDDLDNTNTEAHLLLPQNEENVEQLLSISDDEEDNDSEQQFIDPKMPLHLEEADKISFVTSHFKESSDEDEEEKLTKGLSFSDIHDEGLDTGEKLEGESKVLGVIGDLISQSHSSLVAALKSPVLSQTVSSVMSNTLSGISVIKDTVVSMAGQGTGSSTNRAPSTETESSTRNVQQLTADAQISEVQILDSEFEFLEQEELDGMNTASSK